MDSSHDIERRNSASTEQPTNDDLEVQFLTFGPGYRVVTAAGREHIVDVDGGSCSCDSHRENDARCEHLRRADQAIRTGELPGPDGRYVR